MLKPLAVGLSAAAFGGVLYHCYLCLRLPKEAPIRWSWIPLLGSAIDFGSDPLHFIKQGAKRYGEVFGCVVAGSRMFFITDPHDYAIVMKANPNILSFQEFHDQIMGKFFGISSNTLKHDGYDSKSTRGFYTKHLAGSGIGALISRMQRHLLRNLGGVQEGVCDLYQTIGRLVFDASVAGLFNGQMVEDGAPYREFQIFDQALGIAASGVDISTFPHINRSRSLLVQRILENKSDGSHFMNARWEHFDKCVSRSTLLPDEAAKAQLAILWAASGNSIPATFWLFYYLMTNQSAYERVMKEIEVRAPNRRVGMPQLTVYQPQDVVVAPLGRNPTMEDLVLLPPDKLSSMVYLDACFTETLRLTSGNILMRLVKEPCELTFQSGTKYRFRKGDKIGLFPMLTQRDTEIWGEDVDCFRPERWLQGDTLEEHQASSVGKIKVFKSGKALEYPFLGFGGGHALCPGRKFVRSEMKSLAASLLMTTETKLVRKGAVRDSNGRLEFDNTRAGFGVFPPKSSVQIEIKQRQLRN